MEVPPHHRRNGDRQGRGVQAILSRHALFGQRFQTSRHRAPRAAVWRRSDPRLKEHAGGRKLPAQHAHIEPVILAALHQVRGRNAAPPRGLANMTSMCPSWWNAYARSRRPYRSVDSSATSTSCGRWTKSGWGRHALSWCSEMSESAQLARPDTAPQLIPVHTDFDLTRKELVPDKLSGVGCGSGSPTLNRFRLTLRTQAPKGSGFSSVLEKRAGADLKPTRACRPKIGP